jgi:hypothetical protein
MRILTTICAAALLLCGAMFAQNMVDQLNVRLSTPVAVGDATLPAGNVNIQILRGSGDNVTLVFRAESGVITTALVNRIYTADDTGEGARLVLKNNGAISRLDRILMGDRTGFQLLSQD